VKIEPKGATALARCAKLKEWYEKLKERFSKLKKANTVLKKQNNALLANHQSMVSLLDNLTSEVVTLKREVFKNYKTEQDLEVDEFNRKVRRAKLHNQLVLSGDRTAFLRNVNRIGSLMSLRSIMGLPKFAKDEDRSMDAMRSSLLQYLPQFENNNPRPVNIPSMPLHLVEYLNQIEETKKNR